MGNGFDRHAANNQDKQTTAHEPTGPLAESTASFLRAA